MSTTTLEAPRAELPRLDWPFLLAAVLGAAVLVVLVWLDGHPASAALVILGFALGAAFLKTEFSFTAAWRRFLVKGEAGGMLGALLLTAVASLVIVPVAALVPGFGGAIAPIGPSLVIGAFVFGIGMQLANGCGSGTLYTAGGGSGRMLIALALFIVGSVIGSLHLPAFLRLGGIDPVLASNYFGPWGGLAVTLASIAVAALLIVAFARSRGASFKPRPLIVIGAIVIGVLAIGVFLAGHHPWSVTFGFTVWGAKLAALAGARFLRRGVLAMAGAEARARRVDPLRHLEPDRPRHDPGRDGGGRRDEAVRAHRVAAGALAPRCCHRRPADGLGRAHRLRLQHRRLLRRGRLRLAARLDLVCGGARRLPDRHPVAPAVRPFARLRLDAHRLCIGADRGAWRRDRRPSRQPVIRARRLAGRFRRRLRALRRAVSVGAEEISASS